MFGLIEVHQGRDFGPMRHFWGGVGSIIGTGGDLPGEISQGQEAPGESSPTKIKTHEAIFCHPANRHKRRGESLKFTGAKIATGLEEFLFLWPGRR
jgi:hypothetical protein